MRASADGPARSVRLGPACLGLLLAAAGSGPVGAQEVDSELFARYLEARDAGARAELPDYSHAGYRRCELPLPTVTKKTHKLFDVTRFGARPDDGRSDRKAVLKALDKAHKHKGPAVVFFPPGRYRLFEPGDVGRAPIEVKRSGLVLQGAGVGATELFFAEAPVLRAPLIAFRSSSGEEDYWRGDRKIPGSLVRVVDAFSLELSDVADVEPGVWLNLNPRIDPQKALEGGYYGPHELLRGIRERAASREGALTDHFELHQVVRVEGNVVTFGEPIHLDLSAAVGGSIYRIENGVEEVGIEDLTLRGGWRGQFKHHSGTRYGEDFRMLSFDRVFHGWARRLRFVDTSVALETWLSAFNTFRDLVLEGNAGHNAITCRSSYGTLVAYVREQTDTHHGLGVSRSGVGTVFLRCVQYGGMEAHCGYPRATLFDLNEGGFAPRGGGATFFPMHDEGLTFWNWKVTVPGSFDFWPAGQSYGYFLLPVVAGLHGERFQVPDVETDLLAFESPGTPVAPASLFEAQLEHRLGELPAWLAESSEAFERASRHARLTLDAPADGTELSAGAPLEVRVSLHEGFGPQEVARIELRVSSTSRWDGFETVATIDAGSLETSFVPEAPGVWLVRVRMTNVRGEVTETAPVTVFVAGEDPERLLEVDRIAFLDGDAKQALYKDLVARGGGEAEKLVGSAVLAKRGDAPVHEIEEDYREELSELYRGFGEDVLAPLLEDEQRLATAGLLIDGDTSTAPRGLYHWMDSLVQVAFAKPALVSRIDVHWKRAAPTRPIRLEVQVSEEADAWTSVVNDDRAWEFGTLLLGGPLTGGILPAGEVTTLRFPPREARAVRLLLGQVPDEVTELAFYGPGGRRR